MEIVHPDRTTSAVPCTVERRPVELGCLGPSEQQVGRPRPDPAEQAVLDVGDGMRRERHRANADSRLGRSVVPGSRRRALAPARSRSPVGGVPRPIPPFVSRLIGAALTRTAPRSPMPSTRASPGCRRPRGRTARGRPEHHAPTDSKSEFANLRHHQWLTRLEEPARSRFSPLDVPERWTRDTRAPGYRWPRPALTSSERWGRGPR